MLAIGFSGAGIALAAVPLAGVWAWISFRLGNKQEQLAGDESFVEHKDKKIRRQSL
jgi:hypothetical protein